MSPTPDAASAADDRPRALTPEELDREITRHALDAQHAMLPYALGFFGICLPVYVWTAAYALNSVWLAASLGLFAFNWAMFYAVIDWMKSGRSVEARLRVHVGCGLLWAFTLGQICILTAGAGWIDQTLIVLCAGAAAGVIFFASPVLRTLLIVGPAAAFGPVVALMWTEESRDVGALVLGGLCLALALAMILNRHLREHFALAVERERLAGQREEALTEAERLARSKSMILATLSHEIRNGLSGVAHVLAGALGAGSRGAPSRDQLAAALSAARDLVEVLDATLDSETAEAGKLTVAARPLDAVQLVADMVLLHRPAAAGKGLELLSTVDPDLPATGAAVGDGARVRQILNNLVGNAVKYTQRGRIELRVCMNGDKRLRFEVVDTGPGLAAAELAKAFEPFSRVARNSVGIPGAGLGLSLSRRLAALMGGEVSAESAPGVGSRFWLELPFDPEAETPDTASPAAEPAARPLRVLVAEDDALNAAMLRAVLEQLGHRVLHVGDGRRAVDMLRMGEIDLVMLDGRMPHMDGPTTARALRKLDGEAGRLPIVAVIGGDAEEADEMMKAGADAVLRKPVSVAGVARAVADASRAERTTRRSEAA